MDLCTMHDRDVECGPISFGIPKRLSNGTVLPKTRSVSVLPRGDCGYNALRINYTVCSFNAT